MLFWDSHGCTHVGYRVAIRVANFSRGYTIALLLLVAVKENGFLQVKRDCRFITTNPLQRRGVTTWNEHKRCKVSKQVVPQDRLVKLKWLISSSRDPTFTGFLWKLWFWISYVALLGYHQFRKLMMVSIISFDNRFGMMKQTAGLMMGVV